MQNFYRYPHTPHIKWLGKGVPRDDKVLSLSDVSTLLNSEVIIEEKIDGANLGFTLDLNGNIRAQNRGSYLHVPFSGQFSRLNGWLQQHKFDLLSNLSTDILVFGEWCAARHSLDYSHLADFFLLFDIYDKRESKFWSVQRRNEWAKKTGLFTVPCIQKGLFTTNSLEKVLKETKSMYRDGPVEGIVIRKDNNQWNTMRAKLVHADFTQTISEHWSSRVMEWNSVDYGNKKDALQSGR